MKRLREGFKFPHELHMWSRFDKETGELEIIPADENWQFMFRFMGEIK